MRNGKPFKNIFYNSNKLKDKMYGFANQGKILTEATGLFYLIAYRR